MAPMIIFGDFNLHHPMWGSDHISRYSDEFVEWITDSNLVLLNTTVPTYRSSADATSLLDLTVCSSSISGYCNSYVLDCSFESDHSPNITELSLLNSNKRIFKITDTDQKLNILQLNNRFITHPQLQADLFADYFASKNAYHEPLPLDFLYDKNNLLNKPFHILELHSAIKNSKNTTPGADHVTAIFFKNLDQGQRESDTMASAVLADPTRALQGTNRESGPDREESKNDVGSLEQLLLYADEYYLAGKLPLGDHLGKVLHGVE
ncbi:putative RNA-directed DNA polymerase from transposon BS [Trichonephila clavipes]|nr:putative RNA-directed DNA polymerase from transposon BS [Trichonephila clavipes]